MSKRSIITTIIIPVLFILVLIIVIVFGVNYRDR